MKTIFFIIFEKHPFEKMFSMCHSGIPLTFRIIVKYLQISTLSQIATINKFPQNQKIYFFSKKILNKQRNKFRILCSRKNSIVFIVLTENQNVAKNQNKTKLFFCVHLVHMFHKKLIW